MSLNFKPLFTNNYWLVTGACGYIGSNLVAYLTSIGEPVIALDNLRSGLKTQIDPSIPFIHGDIRNSKDLHKVNRFGEIKGVFNLAGLKYPEESITQPELYWDINVNGVKTILDFMKREQISILIQASSCSVYGNLSTDWIDENQPTIPITPYGESKLGAEKIINEASKIFSLKTTNLRFFNVAGASNKLLADKSYLNLIPSVIRDVKKGNRPKIFGSNYVTPDGTCIRDFIHVEDVIEAMYLAAKCLENKNLPPALNLGSGTGYSVGQIVDHILNVLDRNLQPQIFSRRQGDPAVVRASILLAQKEINFTAKRSLKEMILSSI
jgi:UDP-glucose 4-epimerase